MERYLLIDDRLKIAWQGGGIEKGVTGYMAEGGVRSD
jgi:hypothetical protein